MSPLTENSGRAYVSTGQSAKLAQLYHSAGISPEEFSRLSDMDHFLYAAPIVAVALAKSGQAKEAEQLLSLAATKAKAGLADDKPTTSLLLARVYAAQGRKEEALPLLAAAVGGGWLPQPPTLLADIREDPPLASLNGDPRFEQLRQQILEKLRRERAQVNLRLLRQVGGV